MHIGQSIPRAVVISRVNIALSLNSIPITMSQQNDIGTFSVRLYMEANKVVCLLEMPQVESDPFFN